jgi:hypothetical protein
VGASRGEIQALPLSFPTRGDAKQLEAVPLDEIDGSSSGVP